jgi:hypothetical protein
MGIQSTLHAQVYEAALPLYAGADPRERGPAVREKNVPISMK